MNLTEEDYADRIIFHNNAAPAASYRHVYMLFMQMLTPFNPSTQRISNDHTCSALDEYLLKGVLQYYFHQHTYCFDLLFTLFFIDNNPNVEHVQPATLEFSLASDDCGQSPTNYIMVCDLYPKTKLGTLISCP